VYPDPSRIDLRWDSRSISAENPTGARGAGGATGGGRKGSPARVVAAGETLVLADIEGPGTVRHVWMTVPPDVGTTPAVRRALILRVFYDDLTEPSISAPLYDFFGCPHGRPVPFSSAVHAIQEGLGLNITIPMPFGRRMRWEVVNASPMAHGIFFQIDYTLEAEVPESRLHVTFRRQNPTRLRDDFTIFDDLDGPGRFLGSVVGIRPLSSQWFGEGEVKMYLDGDDDLPTICGTGLEDYVGSGNGLRSHTAPFAGAPLVSSVPPGVGLVAERFHDRPEWVTFYRWHIPDPIVFRESLRVTLQQLGGAIFLKEQRAERLELAKTAQTIGGGWYEHPEDSIYDANALYEREDDYCATAFVYLTTPQPVPDVDVALATADLAGTDSR
jgi:hypothetical protein